MKLNWIKICFFILHFTYLRTQRTPPVYLFSCFCGWLSLLINVCCWHLICTGATDCLNHRIRYVLTGFLLTDTLCLVRCSAGRHVARPRSVDIPPSHSTTEHRQVHTSVRHDSSSCPHCTVRCLDSSVPILSFFVASQDSALTHSSCGGITCSAVGISTSCRIAIP